MKIEIKFKNIDEAKRLGLDVSQFQRNVIVLIFDSLPEYQFREAHKPFIDKLMKEGLYYDKAYSPANWTLPSLTSFFCGRLPHQNGSEQILQQVWNVPKLACEAGYNVYFYGVAGMCYFFPYRQYFTQYNLYKEESFATPAVDDMLKNVKEPYIIFWLINETHYWFDHGDFKTPDYMKTVPPGAYFPKPKPRPGQMEYLRDKQIEAVTFVDGQIKRLIENVGGDPLTIITADHGTCFGEEGVYYHAWGFHENLYHVPLLIHNKKNTKQVMFDYG